MSVDASLVPMRPLGSNMAAGARSSDGMDIETPWHYHDLHQIIYAFEGSVEVQDQLARYKVPHQFAAWIPAGTIHRTQVQKVRSGSVFLSPAMVDVQASDLKVFPASHLMREMIIHAMRWPIDGAGDSVSGAYFECFAKLCAEWLASEVKLVLPASNTPRISAIMDFTRRHLATVTLTDVCRAAGMSERSLRRHFRQAAGMSWEEFRLRLRIYLAIDKLEDSNLPIGVIAAEVGYASQTAFAKAFKTIMGVEPSVYRRTQR